MLTLPPLPDLHAVSEQAQPQPPVRRRLVLQQHVHQHRRFAPLPFYREQQIRLVAAPVVRHEATSQHLERRPLQGVGERLRHAGTQQAGGVPLVREHALEVLVVRLVDRFPIARVRLPGCLLVGHETRRNVALAGGVVNVPLGPAVGVASLGRYTARAAAVRRWPSACSAVSPTSPNGTRWRKGRRARFKTPSTGLESAQTATVDILKPFVLTLE